MDISTIPIGQTVTAANTASVRTTIQQISEQHCLVEYFNPANGAMVLKAKVAVYSGATEIQYQDQSFWTVTVNGRPIGSGEQVHGAASINAETRTINIRT
jgi:hypothetical protein